MEQLVLSRGDSGLPWGDEHPPGEGVAPLLPNLWSCYPWGPLPLGITPLFQSFAQDLNGCSGVGGDDTP